MLSGFFSMKGGAVIGASSLVASLFGVSLAAAIATGLTLHLGKTVLEIREKKRQKNLFEKQNPVAYLIDLKRIENL